MIVAWHGWRIETPGHWSPVRLEGDGDQGYLLMADLHSPCLGIRWKTIATKAYKAKAEKAVAQVNRALVQEIGSLAAAEARPAAPPEGEWLAPQLYEDKEPPGRDVWVGYSPLSGRLFELVYHAHQRDRVLEQRVLPTLCDGDRREATDWSIFDLSCRVPKGFELLRHRLNAGDLSLIFESKKKVALTVRQVAVAKLALQRRPLQDWLREQASWRGKYFKLDKIVEELEQEPRLIRRRIARRWQYGWMRWLPREYVALAKHDTLRDRLVLIDATDQATADAVMQSVAWAKVEEEAE